MSQYDNIKTAMDMMYDEEITNELDKLEQEKREAFFEALGVPDDGRLNATMTREEFYEFTNEAEGGTHKVVSKWESEDIEGKRMVEIYFEFAAYFDYGYAYCFDNGLVYESSRYIGD